MTSVLAAGDRFILPALFRERVEAAATERGIAVCNVPGRNGVATAEMTLGLLLAVLRRIPMTQRTLEDGRWEGGFYRDDRVGFEVSGATIGLIGAGAVGGHVARILDAMGADVLVYDPFLPAGALEGVVELVDSIDEVFRRADIVSIHARLTPETTGLVSAERLALMRPGSYLVSAARGGLVDYDAVTDAIVSGQLGGAAFDVFPSEPGGPLVEMTGFSSVSMLAVPAGTSMPGLIHSRHCIPGVDLLIAAQVTAGAAIDWVNGLDPATDVRTSPELARRERPSRVSVVPSLQGERTPTWNPAARGIIDGADLATDIDLFAQSKHPITEVLATGGGATSPLWLQIKADVTGVPVHKATRGHGAAQGAYAAKRAWMARLAELNARRDWPLAS